MRNESFASRADRLNPAISVVLIDDNALLRDGVVALIRQQPGFRVLATSSDIEKALDVVCDLKPDVVLLAIGREGEDRLTLTGALHGEAPESRVIIIGMEPSHVDVASFVRAGVSGFVLSGASFDEYLRTIQSVAHGHKVLPLDLTRTLFAQLKRYGVRARTTRTLDLRRLTRREQQVAGLIVQGLSNKEIGVRLGIALHTVKSHAHSVFAKLAVNSRLELAAFSHSGATLPEHFDDWAVAAGPPSGELVRFGSEGAMAGMVFKA